MAVLTLQELIAQKEKIKNNRTQKYEIETSAGTVVAILPDAALVAEALDINGSFEANKYIVYNCITDPDLKNDELHKVFGVFEPVDIVSEIFLPGEITKIANKLLDMAGFKNKLAVKLHNEIKN